MFVLTEIITDTMNLNAIFLEVVNLSIKSGNTYTLNLKCQLLHNKFMQWLLLRIHSQVTSVGELWIRNELHICQLYLNQLVKMFEWDEFTARGDAMELTWEVLTWSRCGASADQSISSSCAHFFVWKRQTLNDLTRTNVRSVYWSVFYTI